MFERLMDISEKAVEPPEWDTGIFDIKDSGNVVGILWVSSGVEYWGLGPNYVWPSVNNQNKTFNYVYTTAYTITNTTEFKATCDTKFGSGNTAYYKHTITNF